MKTESHAIYISSGVGAVSAEVMEPPAMETLLVLAHGAGAGMNHRFMEALAQELGNHGIGTLRYNFPYMEQGRRMPDPPGVAEKTVAIVLDKARTLYPGIRLLAGGKSFGGRMTSQYISKHCPEYVQGIVFYGFPLHPAGKPATDRAAHLKNISLPMLFLQGTRDTLAQLDLIEGVCKSLPSASLEKFEGADHSFKVGKTEITAVLAERTGEWVERIG